MRFNVFQRLSPFSPRTPRTLSRHAGSALPPLLVPLPKATRVFFGAIAWVALGLPPAAAQLRLLTPEGAPVEGAHLELILLGQGQLEALLPGVAKGRSDPEGRIALPIPALATAVLRVDHPLVAPTTVAAHPPPPHGELVLDPGMTWAARLRVPGVTEFPADSEVCVAGSFPEVAGRQRSWRRCGPVQGGGEFVVRGLPPAPWQVGVRIPGFLPALASSRGEATLEVTLQPGIDVNGVVVNRRGEAIPSASVACSHGQTTTASDGRFRLTVPAVPVTLRIKAPGFVELQLDTPLERAPLTVTLEDAPGLDAVLLTEHGPFFGEVTVLFRRFEETAVVSRDVVVEEGKFVLPLSEPGRYHLRLQPLGFAEIHLGYLELGPGQRVFLGVLSLSRGSGFAGRVVAEGTGLPVAGAVVEVLPVGSQALAWAPRRRRPWVITDPEGAFTLGGLPSGRYHLRFSHALYATAHEIVDAKGIADLGTVFLGPGRTLRGRIVNAVGVPQEGVTAQLFDAGREVLEPLLRGVSGEEGWFALANLAPGRYRLELGRERLLLGTEVTVGPGEETVLHELPVGGVRLTGVVVRDGLLEGGGHGVAAPCAASRSGPTAPALALPRGRPFGQRPPGAPRRPGARGRLLPAGGRPGGAPVASPPLPDRGLGGAAPGRAPAKRRRGDRGCGRTPVGG